MRDRGFTPTQLRQLEAIVRRATEVPQQVRELPHDPGRIYFSGSLDSRELLGNIADGLTGHLTRKLTAVVDVAPSVLDWVKRALP